MTDLNTKEIYIQWENAPDSHGNTEKNASVPWVRDIVSKPDKIIFGWPISSEITCRPGPIKFSVRFVSFDETKNPKELTYSFSTLTASVNINPSQNLDIQEEGAIDIINHNNLILSRLVNTNPIGGQIAQEPKFFADLDPIVNLSGEIPNQSEILRIQADSADAGVISVEWKRMQDNKDTSYDAGGNYLLDTFEEYVKTDDITFQAGKSYYTKTAEEPVAYIMASVEDGATIPTSGTEYYEKFYACTVTTTGVYYAVVSNRVHHSFTNKESSRCEVPKPVSPNISSFTNRLIIEKDVAPTEEIQCIANVSDAGKMSYKWMKDGSVIEGATGSTYTPAVNAEGVYLIVVSNNLNNTSTEKSPSEGCRVTYAAGLPVISAPDPSKTSLVSLNASGVGKLLITLSDIPTDGYNCEWYKYNHALDEDSIYPGESDTLLAAQNAIVSNQLSYEVNVTGLYYAKIKNTRNGTESEPVYSCLFSVT